MWDRGGWLGPRTWASLGQFGSGLMRAQDRSAPSSEMENGRATPCQPCDTRRSSWSTTSRLGAGTSPTCLHPRSPTTPRWLILLAVYLFEPRRVKAYTEGCCSQVLSDGERR